MRKRHQSHRYYIKRNENGFGAHFFKHAEEMGINMDSNMDDIMQYFKLIIITSADKCTVEEWKDMEASMMQTMKTTQDHGGMNIILEREQDQKQWKCKHCDFRANLQSSLSNHKRRDHSDYMLLCDRCGYTTNDLGHFNRHVRRMHPKYL